MITEKELQAFDELRHWCQVHNALIYSGDDGNVWVCINGEHFRTPMITKDKDAWNPFEKVSYEDVWSNDTKG